MGHGVVVLSVETSVVVRAVVEVFRVVVGVMVTVLHLVVSVVVVGVVVHLDVLGGVVVAVQGQIVVHVVMRGLVVVLIHVLNVVLVLVGGLVVRSLGFFGRSRSGSSWLLGLSGLRVRVVTVTRVSSLVVVRVVGVGICVGAVSFLALAVVLNNLIVAEAVRRVFLRFVAWLGVVTVLLAPLAAEVARLGVRVFSLVSAVLLMLGGTLVLVASVLVVLGGTLVRVPGVLVGGLVVDWDTLDFVIVVLVVVSVRLANLLGVGVVVGTLGDDVVLFGASHGEVERLVLLVFIVVGVVLVASNVFRGHMVVSGVLVVMGLIRVAFVVGISRRVISLAVSGSSLVRCFVMGGSVLRSVGSVMLGSSDVRGLVVHWGSDVRSLNMTRSFVMDWNLMSGSLVVNGGNDMGSFVVYGG